MKAPYEYKRILSILDEYWLTQPEEEYVEVQMYFRKSDGQEQRKTIIWNPAEERRKQAEKDRARIERYWKFNHPKGETEWRKE